MKEIEKYQVWKTEKGSTIVTYNSNIVASQLDEVEKDLLSKLGPQIDEKGNCWVKVENAEEKPVKFVPAPAEEFSAVLAETLTAFSNQTLQLKGLLNRSLQAIKNYVRSYSELQHMSLIGEEK